MKYTLASTVLAVVSILFTPSVPAYESPATDGENFGQCKRAAQQAFGETSKVTILRLHRYKGEFKGRLRLYNENVNGGKSFVFMCVIDKTGALQLLPSGSLSHLPVPSTEVAMPSRLAPLCADQGDPLDGLAAIR